MKQYSFRNPAKITRWVRGTLWCAIASQILLSGALAQQYRLLVRIASHNFASREEMMAAATASDFHVQLMSWILLVVAILGSVLFFIWVYRTSANVHALGARELFVTPGVAVASFFIPFFNLYAPPITMSQVWKASADAPRWTEQKGTALVPLWWFLQLFAGVGGAISIFASGGAHEIAVIEIFTIFRIVLHGMGALLDGTVIALVSRISREQINQQSGLAGSENTVAT